MPDDKKSNTQEAAESNVQKEEPTLVTTEVEEDFVDSLMEKYDTESKFATIEGFTKKAVTVISVLMAIFQLYIAGFSFLNVNNQQNRVVFIHKHHASPYLINYVFYVIRILLTKDKTCQFYKIMRIKAVFSFFLILFAPACTLCALLHRRAFLPYSAGGRCAYLK